MKHFKNLCVVMIMALIVSSMPVYAVNAQAYSEENVSEEYGVQVSNQSVQTAVPDGYTAIYTAEDFYKIRDNLAGQYILMNDIEIETKTKDDLEYIFQGVLDGNNKTIKTNSDEVFYKLGESGKICNLNIEMPIIDSNIEENGMMVIINHMNIGLVYVNYGLITNCNVTATAADGCVNVYGAGIAYINYGEISGCNVTVNSEPEKYEFNFIPITLNNEGGIISHCSVDGAIGTSSISCNNYGEINNCTNYADITCSDSICLGGIASFSTGIVSNCINYGAIQYTGREGCLNRCGGIVGEDAGTVINCENRGAINVKYVSGVSVYAGGIVGSKIAGAMADCSNCADITVDDYTSGYSCKVGGIIGCASYVGSSTNENSYYYVYMDKCVNEGSTIIDCSEYEYIGELVGVVEKDINIVLKDCSGTKENSEIGYEYEGDNEVTFITGDNYDIGISVDNNYCEIFTGEEQYILTGDATGISYYIRPANVVSVENGTLKALASGYSTVVMVSDDGKFNYVLVHVIDKEFTWDIVDGVLTINGTGEMPVVNDNNPLWSSRKDEITKIIIGEGITTVSKSVFEEYTNLEQVIFPDSLEKIDSFAFWNCKKLGNVDLKNVVSINQGAFEWCPSITKVVIPGTVRFLSYECFGNCNELSDVYIEESAYEDSYLEYYDAFSNCKKLEEIRVSDKRTDIVSIDGLLYKVLDRNENYGNYILPEGTLRLLQYPAGKKDKEYTLPDSVSDIWYDAIEGLPDSLEKLTLNEGLASIRSNRISGLKMLVVPSTVQYAELQILDIDRVINNSQIDLDILSISRSYYTSDTTGEKVDKIYANGTYNRIRQIDSITLKVDKYRYYVGDQVQVEAEISPENAVEITICWTSSDETVATVDQNGIVTFVGKGSVTITAATTDGMVSAPFYAYVYNKVESISLDVEKATINPGWRLHIKAQISPEDACSIDDSALIKWTSSDETVATVDNWGYNWVDVRATGVGTAIICASSGEVSAYCTVTVCQKVTQLSISQNDLFLKMGESEVLTVSIYPSDATNKGVIWSSSDENIATVDQNGKVTAVSTGNAVITVKTQDGSNICEECNVSVTGTTNAVITDASLYMLESTREHIVIGVVATTSEPTDIEYRWSAKDSSGNTQLIQDWTLNNEWLNWTPETFGEYTLIAEARVAGNPASSKTVQEVVYFNPHIKGKCQLPYAMVAPGQPGYLIGVETFENPDQSYQYEMLILDCTLLAEGKDAWVYTTGKFTVTEGAAGWCVWQPQYGYYWTLFRVYDAEGNMIDQACYPFVNAY